MMQNYIRLTISMITDSTVLYFYSFILKPYVQGLKMYDFGNPQWYYQKRHCARQQDTDTIYRHNKRAEKNAVFSGM